MTKIVTVRCKTPHDIIVVDSSETLDALIDSRVASTCGHPHSIIVGGSVEFKTPEDKE